MTTKTKKAAPKSTKKPAPVAKRSASGKTPAEALRKLDFAGLAKEAVTKMKGKKAGAALLGEHPVPTGKTEPAPAPAAKPDAKATKKGEGKAATKREVVPNDAKLTVLFKEVPGRPGSLVYRTRALYLKAKTVGEWREAARAADCDPGYLHGDIKRGLIRVG